MGPPVRLALDDSIRRRPLLPRSGSTTEPAAPVGPLVMRCGALRNSDGKKLKGAKVRFAPREVEPLPPAPVAQSRCRSCAKDALRPGIYRGTIQADGAPQLWLPIEVVIEPC